MTKKAFDKIATGLKQAIAHARKTKKKTKNSKPKKKPRRKLHYVSVRLDVGPELHERIASAAKAAGVSVNTFVNTAIAMRLEREGFGYKIRP